MIVRFFCVGEALSIPLLHSTWKAARQPLTFGFAFLDWVLPMLSEDDRTLLGEAADRTRHSAVRLKQCCSSLHRAIYSESTSECPDTVRTIESSSQVRLAAHLTSTEAC